MTTLRVETNFTEARQRVRDLSVKINRAITRNALRTAGNVLKRRAADNLRAQGNAALAKDLMVSSRVSQTKAQASIGAKKRTRLGRLGHLLENGVKPHKIRAGGKKGNTGKKVLADSGTDTFFGPEVNHPGSRPRPWLRPATEASRGEIRQVVEQAINAEIQKAQIKGAL